MKTIGIMGGMGSYATLYTFKKILDACNYIDNESNYPHIIINNNPKLPSRVRAILYNEKKEELLEGLRNGISALSLCGAKRILIPCNTAHYFYNDIVPKNTNVLNMVRITKDVCTNKYNKIGVLASEGTIKAKIYGEDVIYPDESRWPFLRSIIEDVKRNKVSLNTYRRLTSEINEFKDVDCVILACTEFSVLSKNLNSYHLRYPICDALDEAIKVLIK